MKRALGVVLLLFVAGCGTTEADVGRKCRDAFPPNEELDPLIVRVSALTSEISALKSEGFSFSETASFFTNACSNALDEVLVANCVSCSLTLVNVVYGR